MTYTALYNKDLQTVEVKIQGPYRSAEGKEALIKALELIKEHKCTRTLADMREAQLKFSVQDLYHFPNILREMTASLGLPAFKKALVVKEVTSEVRFFENVMINRGQHIKIFLDIEEARNWLLVQQETAFYLSKKRQSPDG